MIKISLKDMLVRLDSRPVVRKLMQNTPKFDFSFTTFQALYISSPFV